MKQTAKNIQDPNPHRIKRSIHARVIWLYAVFALLSVMIIVQMLLTQWGPNGRALRNLSNDRCYSVNPVEGSRGNIYDRNGRILSTDSRAYTIRLDFGVETLTDDIFYKNISPLADSLGRMFGRPRSFYYDFLRKTYTDARNGGDRYKMLARRLDQRQYDRLRTFPLMTKYYGMIEEQERTRYKVYGGLAAYTISQGIEKAYDSILRQTDGVNRFVKLDALSRNEVPIVDTVNRPACNGNDIITTIDVDLQDVVESALRKRLLSNEAMSGTAVVMECATGEIRAMANLTRYRSGHMEDDFNYAIKWHGDPGSTFKGVSLLVLLDEAKISPARRVDCGETGKVLINGMRISDTHKVGKTTVKGMFAESSNIGFAKTVDEIYREQPERFINRIRAIGLDKVSDIQAMKGLGFYMKDPSSYKRRGGWSHTTLTQNAYGYELNMTPLHTLMFYNAVANEGRLIKPILVKDVVRDGEVIRSYRTETVNPEICSALTLSQMQECMEAVIREGTGKQIKDLPFRVAGKTGTAQVYQAVRPKGARTIYETADGGRDYLATFVGYFPAEAPKYSCIVSIKTHLRRGEWKEYTGAGVSLPVFREIADYIYTHEETWMPSAQKKHPTALQQKPRADISKTIEGVMPSVEGMGLRDALYLLESLGLDVSFKGKGSVVGQSIEVGAEYTDGDSVELTLQVKED